MITLKELLDLAPNQDEYVVHYDGGHIISLSYDDFANYPYLENREVTKLYGYNAEGYDGLEVYLK